MTATVVARHELVDGLLRWPPLAQEREAVAAVGHIHPRLRHDCADIDLHPRDEPSNRGKLRLDGRSPLPLAGINATIE